MNLDIILWKTITDVKVENNDCIIFTCDDGSCFEASHMQDCCEEVKIYDINEDLSCLIGEEIIGVKEEESKIWPNDVGKENFCIDSFTWTTHTFQTSKNTVIVRWIGLSNGFYSEKIHFTRTHKQIPMQTYAEFSFPEGFPVTGLY